MVTQTQDGVSYMIDTDKYEGHLASEGQTWAWSKWMLKNAETIEQHEATSALLNDAPLLLEFYKEVKRIMDIDEILETSRVELIWMKLLEMSA